MHSFLVSSAPDIKPSPSVLQISPDPSIGISDIRQVISFLSRKPLQHSQNTVIILQADKMTLPAQHAILKTLEEPPGNSKIYLVTRFPDTLLPTILSRVQTQKATAYQLPAQKEISNSQILLEKLISAKDIGERMVLIDSTSFTRETFAQFLDNLEHIFHHKILNSQFSILNYLIIVQSRKYLNANVTLQLILDNFAIYL